MMDELSAPPPFLIYHAGLYHAPDRPDKRVTRDE
jgi:hypothetical protein